MIGLTDADAKLSQKPATRKEHCCKQEINMYRRKIDDP